MAQDLWAYHVHLLWASYNAIYIMQPHQPLLTLAERQGPAGLARCAAVVPVPWCMPWEHAGGLGAGLVTSMSWSVGSVLLRWVCLQ